MKKRSKGGNGSNAAAVVVLALIGIGIVSALPWLVPVIAVIAAAVFLVKIWAASGNPQKRNTSPLQRTVDNDIRIMGDCVKILNTSSNLQTVVHRYDDLIAVLQRLCEYEGNPAVSFPRELPSDVLARITSEKTQIMNRAIQRAYDDVLHKCAALKTEKGRKNRQMKFFDEINSLMGGFPDETRDFAVDFINQNIDDPLTDLEGL